MTADIIIYLILSLIALCICCVYLYFIDKHMSKNDKYYQELINKLDDIERSINEKENKKE